MNRWPFLMIVVLTCLASAIQLQSATCTELDEVLKAENKSQGVTREAMPVCNDMAIARRLYVDLIGRIPTNKEINAFLAMPQTDRRERLIDQLLAKDRYVDRWTTFFCDMLRLRSNTPGGTRLIAYMHDAVQNNTPFDQIARELIKANGRPTQTPEVAFILGDDADPLAMASVTSQVFMGVRIGCAQCHDHPFDVWTREDFYGLAAYYGRTRRVENMFSRSIYTTEADETTILWPPAGVGKDEQRKPMKATFPFDMISGDEAEEFVAQLTKLRSTKAAEAERERIAKAKANNAEVEGLLNTVGQLRDGDGPVGAVRVGLEAKKEIRNIDINASLYRQSQLRAQLAELVTSPRNRYFSQSFVNRMWAELVGRGFVEPIDDFREDNPASHPETLQVLADEFVASDYDVQGLIRRIVASETYQRQHITGVDEETRLEMESSFLATPMRRMLSEAIYDSIVTAGHLFEFKHPEGANIKTRVTTTRVAVPVDPDPEADPGKLASITPQPAQKAMPAMKQKMAAASGYDLENAIELDFDALLKDADEPSLEKMQVMSKEEIEAQMMVRQQRPIRPGMKYVTKTVETKYDDNPRYNSSFRMASPAPEGHFLRVFGQTSRAELGMLRDRSPSMRQALMILNGRLTNEASRVGPMEVMHRLLVGKRANLDNAVRLAYREILTREPTADETAEAKEIVNGADSHLDGMADLRWVLLTSNEFRFIP